MNPVLEGNETFTVFLSSAIGSSLVQPYIASVVIHDSNLDGRFYNLQYYKQWTLNKLLQTVETCMGKFSI